MPYDGRRHPLREPVEPPTAGANCQRYASAVLALFGRAVPRLRSRELWTDPRLRTVAVPRPLDLVLFNPTGDPYGAHVGVVLGDDEVLHLCREVGRPAVWSYAAFRRRPRYRTLLGARRVPRARLG
ncbi:C40 family peptidase [Micromonospora auratinigra]|uniref:C40 family peptidase n=1 Tax=Micromonospora auratinigra TaxID=261654 RepID=UPI000AC535DB|nr:C40 family peptidase [Micromonospora auratinigra]